MTRLLEQAFQKVQALPPEKQDEVARMLLAYADISPPAAKNALKKRRAA